MKYKVHRVNVKNNNMQEKLEQFINELKGEVISVMPNVQPTFTLAGATAKVYCILVVEKIAVEN
ncbi:MAG: hypothetical protein HN952_07775 [Candidatus Cloacimonetes bacterium]|nr:hypothetical protein [Candidatus Cloacimonadota bacterium]MBT6994830.1 hypothetical protein [Candidatus Cloacimonadota bacterium]MBT7469222.1 hypothetical protein [Candidatus Cloacimonadota bacterium]